MNTSTQRGLKTFYALAISQTISQIGSTMSFFGVAIYVYQKTGEATPLVLMSLFMLLPYLLVSGVAGVLADRFDRRTLMIIGDTGAALGSLALAISVYSGSFQVWHMYLAALWQGVFSTLQRPAFEASVSQLVPEDHRQSANAIMQMGKPVSILFSGALTGLLYTAIGVIGIFMIDLSTFLVAVTTSLLVSIPMPARTEGHSKVGASMLDDWKAGTAFLWSRRPLFILMIMLAFFGFFVSSIYALATPYILARTNSELALGLLNTLMSIGGVVGAVAIGAWGGFKQRMTTILIALFLVLGATMWFGVNQPPLLMGTALFFAMMGVTGANTTFMTVLQSKVPGELQGRIFALFTQLTLALTPLGYLMIGPLADQVFTPLAKSAAWAQSLAGTVFGAGAAGGMGGLFAIGAGLALIAILATFAIPSVRHIETLLPSYTAAPQDSKGGSAPAAETALAS